MDGKSGFDVAFFGPTESNRLLKIDALPGQTGGEPAWEACHVTGADAVIAAQWSAALGMKSILITNPLGNDPLGNRVFDELKESGVINVPSIHPNRETPLTTTFCFPDGTHSCLAYVAQCPDDLLTVDLRPILDANLLYLDLYPHLRPALRRVLDFASAPRVPLFLNLGLFCPSESAKAIDIILQFSLNIAAVQISCDHIAAVTADDAYQSVRTLSAQISIVTLGRQGCIVHHRDRITRINAYRAEPIHTCGAGAAFSAGFIGGYFAQRLQPMEAGRLASALAALHCSRFGGKPGVERLQEWLPNAR